MLNELWFFLLGFLLVGYAILDGFDLGVGALHLFTRQDEERRILLNSIGPVWDGNEVWLVTGGGALFAAFPNAYATSLSGFYIPIMMLLLMLIFRAVSIEFRSKEPMRWWRSAWDTAFSISSVLIAVLLGVAVGNVIVGIPIDADGEFAGTFFGLLNPYALLVGVFALSMFTLQGALYLRMKTEGELQARVVKMIRIALAVFTILYVLTTVATVVRVPSMLEVFHRIPLLWAVVALNVFTLGYIVWTTRKGQAFSAFVGSSCLIAGLMFLFGMGMFPNLLTSTIDPAYSLTIYNAASSTKTLGIMLIMAGIGMPLVLAYTTFIYWTYRGKVKLDKFGY